MAENGTHTGTPQRVGVIGAGAWGTAIARSIALAGNPVEIWSYEEDVARDINREHENSRYLLGVDLPPSLSATCNISEAVENKDFLILAAPSLFILDTFRKIIDAPNILSGTTSIGILTKGFLESAGRPKLIVTALEEMLPDHYQDRLVYLSGPSHAEEVARGKITGLISASSNGKESIRFRELLSSSTLMVFSSLDVVGVQTSAAVKNVIALAFGMLDALKELSNRFGDNTESLLLAAGLNEIQLLGKALGSNYPETFTSIAGVGDLDVTCRSKYGRNRRFGREIILDRKLSRFNGIEDLIRRIEEIGYLPEGVVAAKHAMHLAEEYNLKLPIISGVYTILNGDQSPFSALNKIIAGIVGNAPDMDLEDNGAR
ncbi:MAG: NAD(P)-dependent glycerol-3-phosphate dehydrogenase [Spirochaetales bacterium]|nr:NAD(P)-dependent glycerol-3-phosphate dehydrogenase [Spirochaetales bacterium]MCF7936983.1 NAD(P)-dependent glycerol-3-phosphate dehydrogenase [Spirochaetales bacterium]